MGQKKMSLRIKPGVRLEGLQHQMVIAGGMIAEMCDDYYVDCVITSGTDGDHKSGSLHNCGRALDFRTRDLTASQGMSSAEVREAFRLHVKLRLGAEFFVFLEPTHLHVEYDPK